MSDQGSGATPTDSAYTSWTLVTRMLAFLAEVRMLVILVTVIFLACIGMEVLTVYLLKPAVNIVKKLHSGDAHPDISMWDWMTAATGTGAELRTALLWLLGARLIFGLLSYSRSVTTSWQNMSLVARMRAAVYDRLQTSGFRFHNRYATGHLINRALSDLNHVRTFVNTGLHTSLDILFSFVGYMGMLMWNSPTLGLLALLPVPFWMLALRHFAKKSRPIYVRQRAASDEVVRRMTESIAGLHVIRAFATEAYEREHYDRARNTLLERVQESLGLKSTMTPVLRGILVGTQILMFGFGGILVQRGQIELGDLVIFGVAINRVLAKLQQINSVSDTYHRAMVAGARLFEIIDAPETVPAGPDATPLRTAGGRITLEHVHFTYDDGNPVVKDVSFDIPAGSTVAVVGPTGSGKTTLSMFLGRFYDPDSGTVRIDGQDLKDVTLKSVRRSVGYVFQETYLFADTVANNIAYGSPDATQEMIERAAKIADADEFVRTLPEGYQTVLSESGSILSGGQRQRLALARAILYDPAVLVLDDALSALDANTEQQVRAALEVAMQRRTVFLITSRLSMARNAQLILVIEKGELTQMGTHEELLRQEGYYRSVAESQFGPTETADLSHLHIGRMAQSIRRKGAYHDYLRADE